MLDYLMALVPPIWIVLGSLLALLAMNNPRIRVVLWLLTVVLASLALCGGLWQIRHAREVDARQLKFEDSLRNIERFGPVLAQIAAKLNSNPTSAEVKAAATQLLNLHATIMAQRPTLGGEVVVRDKTGKVVSRSSMKP